MSLPASPPTALSERQIQLRSRVAFVGALFAWAFISLALLEAALNALGTSADFLAIRSTAFVGSVILWAAMAVEYARERPDRLRYMWLGLLLTGPVFGPLAFYHLIWRSRFSWSGAQRGVS